MTNKYERKFGDYYVKFYVAPCLTLCVKFGHRLHGVILDREATAISPIADYVNRSVISHELIMWQLLSTDDEGFTVTHAPNTLVINDHYIQGIIAREAFRYIGDIVCNKINAVIDEINAQEKDAK
jgi:hypothetical protein